VFVDPVNSTSSAVTVFGGSLPVTGNLTPTVVGIAAGVILLIVGFIVISLPE